MSNIRLDFGGTFYKAVAPEQYKSLVEILQSKGLPVTDILQTKAGLMIDTTYIDRRTSRIAMARAATQGSRGELGREIKPVLDAAIQSLSIASKLEARLIDKGQEDLLSKGVDVLHASRPYLNDAENAPDDLVTTDAVMKDITKRGKGKKEFVIVVGTELDDPEKRRVVGYINGIFFPRSGTGALTFVEVSPEHKGTDLERPMVDLAVNQLAKIAKDSGGTLNALFTELEDPSLYTDPSDIAKAKKEITFYKGNGIKAVEVGQAFADKELDYRQPWWYKDDGLLRLYTIPDSRGNIATPADVKGFYADLHAFHSTPRLNNRKGYAAARAITEAGIAEISQAYQNRLSAAQSPPRVDMSNDGPA